MKIRNAIPSIALSALLITNVCAQDNPAPNNSNDTFAQINKNTKQLEVSKAGKVHKPKAQDRSNTVTNTATCGAR